MIDKIKSIAKTIWDKYKNRLKSFLWRLSAFIVVSTIGWIIKNLSDLALPIAIEESLELFFSLLLAEITKHLNK